LQITWTPNKTVTTTPDSFTGFYSLREIVDVREQDEITLNLPYLIADPYLNTNTDYTDYYSGQLDVKVLNDLMSPETCAQNIQVLMFIKAGPDFEFQMPGSSGKGYPGYFAAQSNQADVLVNTGIAESAIKNLNLKHASSCVGECFTSIKQLLNRFGQVVPYTGGGFPTTTAFQWYPWMYSAGSINGAGALTSGSWGGDIVNLLAPMYLFQRGSQRLCITTENQSHLYTANVLNAYTNSVQSWTGQIKAGFFFQLGPNIGLSAANWLPAYGYANGTPMIPNDIGPGISYVQLPYMSRYPVSLIPVIDGLSNVTPVSNGTFPWSTLYCTGSAFGQTTVLNRSFGDDFQLSFFVCCPPLLNSYV